MSTTPTWPKLLSISDYARACSEAGGEPVSRQVIAARIKSMKLPAVVQTVGGKSRTYIDTEQYPPARLPGRWPNRLAGSVPLKK